MRTEKDFLGEVRLEADALYGIHAWRASQNFPSPGVFAREWYKATGLVKAACYQTALSFARSARQKYPDVDLPPACQQEAVLLVMEEVALEVAAGKYYEHFIVPPVQGGAGTAINMNINEIISNASLLKMGHNPGDYQWVDPLLHANLFQSTNDVIPTALKVATMQLLNRLEIEINGMRHVLEQLEREHRNHMRLAFTQMQEALPSSFGMLFSAYNDAFSRDWWRVSKALERIKLVNLGGGATGSGMAIPRYFIMESVNRLRQISRLPIARSENLCDTTQNLDVFVEVHAILKAHAVNLEKMTADLRLLGSDLVGAREIKIPQKQIGSSIMPGKVNPVICEYAITIAHQVYSNDMLISNLCGQGCLDLNAYLPQIGHRFLESLQLLLAANQSVRQNLLQELLVESTTAYEKLMYSPTITTALLPLVGYQKAAEVARLMKQERISIFAANAQLRFLGPSRLEQALKPENLLKLGYSLQDI